MVVSGDCELIAKVRVIAGALEDRLPVYGHQQIVVRITPEAVAPGSEGFASPEYQAIQPRSTE